MIQEAAPVEAPRETSTILFHCPKCSGKLEVSSRGAGAEVACPKCASMLLIPFETPLALAPGDRRHDGEQFGYRTVVKAMAHAVHPYRSAWKEAIKVVHRLLRETEDQKGRIRELKDLALRTQQDLWAAEAEQDAGAPDASSGASQEFQALRVKLEVSQAMAAGKVQELKDVQARLEQHLVEHGALRREVDLREARIRDLEAERDQQAAREADLRRQLAAARQLQNALLEQREADLPSALHTAGPRKAIRIQARRREASMPDRPLAVSRENA